MPSGQLFGAGGEGDGPGGARCPSGVQTMRQLRLRRALFTTLVALTVAAMTAAMVAILSHGGFDWLDGVLLFAFLLSTPWSVVGFWNAAIGVLVLHLGRDPVGAVSPFARLADPAAPIRARVAVAMTLRNEDPARAFLRLSAMRDALDATGWGDRFDVFVLSDSSRPEIIGQEEALFSEWRASLPRRGSVHYRRRSDNAGFKAGNVRDFLERHGDAYELFLPLDADSLMTAAAMLRLVRIAEAHPRIGILQSLAVGLPAPSLFARIFQFGMRHGMRAYTTGSAWWHGDCGPYWGHNAVIRTHAFRDHCRLPVLPGRPPLGGPILSHDQIEAVLMRRAGYEVRVLPVEGGSYEENPPALPDFLKRDLRWCQGNMQYWRLLGTPGLLPTSRVQVFLAIQMYLGAFGWTLFILASALKTLMPPVVGEPFPVALGVTLFCVVLAMSLSPKVLGVVDALLQPDERCRYGGGWRLVAGAAVELGASSLLAPAVAVADTIFMVGLAFGRRVGWEGQVRDGYRLSWAQAVRGLWPQALLGFALAGVIAWNAPAALPWAGPVLAGLCFAPAFAVFTAVPVLGRWAARTGAFAIPEENDPPAIFDGIVDPAAMPDDWPARWSDRSPAQLPRLADAAE